MWTKLFGFVLVLTVCFGESNAHAASLQIKGKIIEMQEDAIIVDAQMKGLVSIKVNEPKDRFSVGQSVSVEVTEIGQTKFKDKFIPAFRIGNKKEFGI